MKDVVYLLLVQTFSSFILQIINNIIETIKKVVYNYDVYWCKFRGYVYYEATQTIIGYDTRDANIIVDHIGMYMQTLTFKGNMDIISLPPNNVIAYIPTDWVYNKVDKVWIKYTHMYGRGSEPNSTIKTKKYEICAIGNNIIDTFIKKCTTHYDNSAKFQNIKCKLFKLTGFSYQLPVFDTHDFSSLCTFDTLFFPQKELIISMLKKLEHGKIRRFNILLSGVPGCGKTSIMKAIINFTQRNAYDIKLSKVRTATELNNLFFGAPDLCKLGQIPNNMKIFLIDEIDECNNLVARRAQKVTEAESSTVDKKDDTISQLKIANDIPTLSDLLTTFDGVHELSGIITIITTNYPELLDDALIREGRIQLHCILKPCLIVDAIQIIKKRYPTYNETTYPLEDYGITPAKLEAFIEMSDNIDQLNTRIVGKWEQ